MMSTRLVGNYSKTLHILSVGLHFESFTTICNLPSTPYEDKNEGQYRTLCLDDEKETKLSTIIIFVGVISPLNN